MKVQDWIFSLRYWPAGQAMVRCAVVGPARTSTIEAALQLATIPEDVRVEIRSSTIARDFVDGKLDPDRSGYYHHHAAEPSGWTICIGSVHDVLGNR